MTIWVVFLGTFLIAVILSMTRPATVLYGAELGMSPFEVGVLVSAYALTPMLIAIRMGMAADRFGDRIVIQLGLSLVACGLVLPIAFQNQPSLFAAQILIGVGQLAAATSLQNLVGKSSAAGDRDRNFAWFATAVAAGSFVGPFVGGVVAEGRTYIAVFVASLTVAVAGLAVAFLLPRGMGHKVEQKPTVRAAFTLLRIPAIRRSFLSGTLIQYSREIFIAYFPLYGALIGLSPLTIGLVLSVQGLSTLLARLLLPFVLRQFSRETVLLASILAAALAFLVVPLDVMAVTYLAAVAMGFGLGCGQPISMTETYNASPPGRSGEVLGLRLTFLRLGQFAAPLFFGAVGSSLGIVGVFFVNGALLLGGGVIVRRQKPPPGGSVHPV